MRNMSILYLDELYGLYRSKAIIVLWLGLPALVMVLKILQPNTEAIPLTIFVSIMLLSLGGIIASVSLGASIASEMNQHVYDLFLVRPVRRHELLLSKFFAVYTVLILSFVITLIASLVTDVLTTTVSLELLWVAIRDQLLITVTNIAIACAAGIIVGINIDSVTVASIVSLYLGEMAAMPILLVVFLGDLPYVYLLVALMGILTAACIMALAIFQFSRKQL